MKSKLRIGCMFFMLVLLLSLFAVPASADPVDASRECTLTLEASIDGEHVPSLPFSVYRVAELSGSAPTITLVEPYASYPISLDGLQGEDWAALAETLRTYVRADTLASDANGLTGEDGRLVFSGLNCGLYLVLGERLEYEGGYLEVTPFLISLPNIADGSWQYERLAKPKLNMVDPESTSLRVLKIWDDAGREKGRPVQLSVHLLCDGEVCESVILTAENSWRWHWEELDASHEWTVVEDIPANYTVTMELIGDCWCITNHSTQTPPPPPPPSYPPSLPQTGLNWWPVLGFGCAGLLLLLMALVVRRVGGREEDTGDEE